MLLLQGSIGSANDLVDIAEDARVKPTKPLVSGLVRPEVARRVAVGGALLGMAAAALGPLTVALAAAGLGCGLLYDLRGKGTPAAPVLLGTGVALLPLFAATGAAEGMGGAPVNVFRAALVVMAALPGGVALALANAAADEPAGQRTRAPLAIACWAAAHGLAVAGLALWGSGSWSWTLVALGAAVGLVGLVRSWFVAPTLSGGHRRGARWHERREVGWELQAVGLALLAVGWWIGVGGLRGGGSVAR
jgi:4-hydroxybenzoate polyprenyltransferase